jgi:uncharacterized protein YggT (Ycf19 family)
MPVIDFTLNLAALGIWLNWRALHFDPLLKSAPATLVGTLRRAEPRRIRSWQLLAGLGLLLALRALFYWEIGSSADWTPKLNLGLVVLAFPCDHLPSVAWFSALSFLRILFVLYFWLLAVVFINRPTAEPDPILKLLRLHLGRVARGPWLVQLLLPFVLITGVWFGLHPLLARLQVVNPSKTSPLLEQGLLLGLAPFVTLKYLLVAFLVLHMVSSYVYLGNHPFWDFIAGTARHLLAPLTWLPLRFAKVDFTPLAGIVLLLLLLHWLPTYVLARLARHGVSVWPG